MSTCAYNGKGKVISGAMDSVVCLWDSHGVRCDHFVAHQYAILDYRKGEHKQSHGIGGYWHQCIIRHDDDLMGF